MSKVDIEKCYPRWHKANKARDYTPPFYVNRILKKIDPVTNRWIRNANDERAAHSGYRFNEKRGLHAVNWMSTNCILYEGEFAGKQMMIEDWQFEFTMQVYGWVHFSTERDRWIRRFNQASAWIPKKNAKSPTLAANGLYMLIGDGEPGQKCYSVARDAKQAMISHNHAMEMVRASDLLSDECRINATTGKITHLPTRSSYMVVSGENRKSTEGFNGSIFIDEVHVVDHELTDRLRYAGISRTEPMHMEMSTAGDSVAGYAYSRYEFGKKVVACVKDDDFVPNFYFLDFSIPEDTKIESLRDKTTAINLGRRVNPTLNRILSEERYLEDWKVAISTITGLRKFAQYRLNLWSQSEAGWIDPQDWNNCMIKDLVPEDFSEHPCVCGLDLSQTTDMTSLTLTIGVADDECGIRPHTWSYHWLPYETAEKYGRKVDFFKWAEQGYLTIVNGRTIDYQIIASHIVSIYEKFDLRCVGYDPYYSRRVIDSLYYDHGFDESLLTPVRQTIPILSPATKELERIILNREISHPDNPVLSWQLGHAKVREDNSGNVMICKPRLDNYQKIDGLASLVNSIAVLYADESIALSRQNLSIVLPGMEKLEEVNKRFRR